MIKETKEVYKTEEINDGNYKLIIQWKDLLVIGIELWNTYDPSQTKLWSISNRDKELGNFLLLMKKYFAETKSL